MGQPAARTRWCSAWTSSETQDDLAADRWLAWGQIGVRMLAASDLEVTSGNRQIVEITTCVFTLGRETEHLHVETCKNARIRVKDLVTVTHGPPSNDGCILKWIAAIAVTTGLGWWRGAAWQSPLHLGISTTLDHDMSMLSDLAIGRLRSCPIARRGGRALPCTPTR